MPQQRFFTRLTSEYIKLIDMIDRDMLDEQGKSLAFLIMEQFESLNFGLTREIDLIEIRFMEPILPVRDKIKKRKITTLGEIRSTPYGALSDREKGAVKNLELELGIRRIPERYVVFGESYLNLYTALGANRKLRAA